MFEPIALVALAVIPFLRAIQGEFLFDDPAMFEGQVPSAQTSFREFHRIPRNLVHVFDGWAWQLAGKGNGWDQTESVLIQSSWPWHTLSLAFHVGTTLCVWSIMSLLFLTPDRAFLAAALFAVHPLQVSAVAYISGRAGVQAAFFSGLGFLHALAGGWHFLLVPLCHYFAWKSKEDGLLYLAFYPVILWKSLA